MDHTGVLQMLLAAWVAAVSVYAGVVQLQLQHLKACNASLASRIDELESEPVILPFPVDPDAEVRSYD